MLSSFAETLGGSQPHCTHPTHPCLISLPHGLLLTFRRLKALNHLLLNILRVALGKLGLSLSLLWSRLLPHFTGFGERLVYGGLAEINLRSFFVGLNWIVGKLLVFFGFLLSV